MIIALAHRAVLKVYGEEALPFLQGLVTADMHKLPAFAALLSPQGKLLVDFFIVESQGAFFLDCPLALQDLLYTKLMLYKLRTKVTLEKTDLNVFALLQQAAQYEPEGICFQDPRAQSMGQRLFTSMPLTPTGTPEAYHLARITACLPQGGDDFTYGDVFPHDVNMHDFAALFYTKGCYVGQEIVARMQHRGNARKKIMRFSVEKTMPPRGTEIYCGESVIGYVGSSHGLIGLALVRIDKLEPPLVAGGSALNFEGQNNG